MNPIDGPIVAAPAAHVLRVTADGPAVAAASAWTRSLAARLHLAPPDVFRLDLCVTELVTNIAEHGYTNGGDRTVELRAESAANGGGIRLEISCSTPPASPRPRTPTGECSGTRACSSC